MRPAIGRELPADDFARRPAANMLHCNISPLEDRCEPYQNTVISDQSRFDKRAPEG